MTSEEWPDHITRMWAFAFAGNSHGPVTVAHSAEIRFLAPVHQGDRLVASAVERSREEQRGVYDVQVHAGDTLVATFTGHATQLEDFRGDAR